MTLDPIVKEDVERLRPLWLALHAHHQKAAPKLGPYVTDDQSWLGRKRQYQDVMAGEFFGFIAREGSFDVGYLLCAKRPMAWNATFAIPPMLWELVTIFATPESRGKGLGTTMLNAMDNQIANSDVQTKLIGVIPDNLKAVALYRSRGYMPTWLTLTRFQRDAPKSRKPNGMVSVERVGAEKVEGLESLWLSLHHHHQTVSSHLGPWVNDNASWSVIRDLLSQSADQGLLFVARSNGKNVGFGSVAVYNTTEVPNWSDTWVVDEQIAETKFLVVAEDERDRGIGSALMDAVDHELATRNVRDHLIGALEPNRSAIGFYESHGFRPAWLELTKF